MPAYDELVALLGEGSVLDGDRAGYGSDESEGAGVHGRPDAVVLPGSTEAVATLMAWCYEHDVALVPRGGGSGFAGGAVAVDGGVVCGLERLDRVRALDPGRWRMHVEAGVHTATVHRLARENGLFFPPDPGAAEQSQIGGNVATNAGGPRAFKYGVTGSWVTGIEAVVPPGEVIAVGGPIRKDVAGYDLRGLLVGSEGTLGVITSAWLRLIPAPEKRLAVAAFHADASAGCAAIEAVLAAGLVPATLEYLDAGALRAAAASFPAEVPQAAGFAVVCEADGEQAGAEELADGLAEALGGGAVGVLRFAERELEDLRRWRDGVSLAVTARRGAKLSEDIVVPLEHLGEAIEATLEIGRRHELEACSWGHAGDGNLHSTFLLDPASDAERERAAAAAEELFELAGRLGGSVSGEHGLGYLKSGQLARQWPEPALRLHEDLKRLFDPKGLLNPHKKLARV